MSIRLKFVSYNTQFCTGRDGRTDVDRIVLEIEGADIICLQEIDRYWSRSGMIDQAEAIAARLPGYYWAYGPGMDVDASLKGMDGHPRNRRRQFGNMVLARWPLLAVRNHLLPKLNLRRQLSVQRAALETVIMPPQAPPMRVISVHLAHAAAEERALQIERLMSIIHEGHRDGGAWSGSEYPESWEKEGPPVDMPAETIVAGDFNLTPDGAEYQTLTGPNDPQFGRLDTQQHLVDAWPELRNAAPGITFDVEGPPRRLDYFFLTRGIAADLWEVRVDQDAEGSDHYPLWMTLDLS